MSKKFENSRKKTFSNNFAESTHKKGNGCIFLMTVISVFTDNETRAKKNQLSRGAKTISTAIYYAPSMLQVLSCWIRLCKSQTWSFQSRSFVTVREINVKRGFWGETTVQAGVFNLSEIEHVCGVSGFLLRGNAFKKNLPSRPTGMKEVTSQMKKFEWLRAKVWDQGFSSNKRCPHPPPLSHTVMRKGSPAPQVLPLGNSSMPK